MNLNSFNDNEYEDIDDFVEKVIKDPMVRKMVTRENHRWFFAIYFRHYLKYHLAPFHREMIRITEDGNNQLTVIVAFRGSGKSSLMTTSYPIWSILGKQQKKFVLILSQTQDKAQQHLLNIKKELESNELLKKDLGPFKEERNQWGVSSLLIKNFGARMSTGSVGQSIRGIRHYQHRPDLIILDDIEDLDSVRTSERRERTYQWLVGEVIPAGDKNTRIVVVGNLLHEDSVLKRLKDQIVEGKLKGNYREYPIADENNNPLWKSKHPTMEDIEKEREKCVDDTAFQREFFLRIISNKERLVQPEWICYYDKLPGKKRWDVITGIDLAISQSEHADFTAMVSANLYMLGEANKYRYGDLHIFILPDPVNERLNFPETVERAKILSRILGNGDKTDLIIEDTGYQAALIQQLKQDGFRAIGFKPLGSDKRSRIALTTTLIKNGRIHFPRKGAEKLIAQLTGFGQEKHDDLCDAFAILVLHAIKHYHNVPLLVIFGGDDDED